MILVRPIGVSRPFWAVAYLHTGASPNEGSYEFFEKFTIWMVLYVIYYIFVK